MVICDDVAVGTLRGEQIGCTTVGVAARVGVDWAGAGSVWGLAALNVGVAAAGLLETFNRFVIAARAGVLIAVDGVICSYRVSVVGHMTRARMLETVALSVVLVVEPSAYVVITLLVAAVSVMPISISI